MLKPIILGVLNVTPDSFSDGNQFYQLNHALNRALQMQAEGADYIDIGGESSRPGAKSVSVDEELGRIMPVIEAIRNASDIKISVDTTKPEVMREVLAYQVEMINDINAFEAKGAMAAVKEADCKLCLMHKQGLPETMQQQPKYDNVTDEVFQYLASRIEACVNNDIAKSRLLTDVGFGFGKTVEHNLSLMKNYQHFAELGVPSMAAVSRKSAIGKILNRKESERLAGSLGLAVMAYLNGAQYFRVHDVAQTHDALSMVYACN